APRRLSGARRRKRRAQGLKPGSRRAVTRFGFLRLPLAHAAAFAAFLAICAPAAAEPAPQPDPCAAGESGEAAGAPPSARPADPGGACHDGAKATTEEGPARPRYGDIPGPGYLLKGRAGARDTMAPGLVPELREQQRLRTAQRINQQGVQA